MCGMFFSMCSGVAADCFQYISDINLAITPLKVRYCDCLLDIIVVFANSSCHFYCSSSCVLIIKSSS